MRYLVDSDFLIACFLIDDFSHRSASEILESLTKDDEIFINSLVEMEAATVVSKKVSMVKAKSFVDWLGKLGLNEIFVDEYMMGKGWKLFLEQTKKGSSFVDCMNLVVAKKMGCDKILAFDKFYPQELRIK